VQWANLFPDIIDQNQYPPDEDFEIGYDLDASYCGKRVYRKLSYNRVEQTRQSDWN
jgi:hypothetical protein